MDGEFNIARWKSREALLNQRVCKVVAKSGTATVCLEELQEHLQNTLTLPSPQNENDDR